MASDRSAYVRNFIFGVEDSLVSTVGLLSGIAITGMPRAEIFATGVILIFVEAISMAAGSFLSESSAEEYETRASASTARTVTAASVMFFSYFISGFVPLAPYLFFADGMAFWTSISASIIALALLGIVGARISKVRVVKSVARMVIIGGLAIAVGVVVGKFVG